MRRPVWATERRSLESSIRQKKSTNRLAIDPGIDLSNILLIFRR